MGHFKEIEVGLINIIPPIPIPGLATQILPTAVFYLKYSFDDLYDGI